MPRWVSIAEAGTIRPGFGRTVNADGRHLAVFNDAGSFHVIDDACPHQGASLGEGFLHDGSVVCPWHNWMFDVRTGVCGRAPHVAVDAYPTRVVEGTIEAALPDEGDDGNETTESGGPSEGSGPDGAEQI